MKRHSLKIHEVPETRLEEVKIKPQKNEPPKQWHLPPEAMTRPLWKRQIIKTNNYQQEAVNSCHQRSQGHRPEFHPDLHKSSSCFYKPLTRCTTEELVEDL